MKKGILWLFGLVVMILVGLPSEVNASNVTDEFIKQFAPDGKNAVFKGVKPTDQLQANFLFYGVLVKYEDPEGYNFSIPSCTGDEYETCTLTLRSDDYNVVYDPDTQKDIVTGEEISYTLNVTYEEPSNEDIQLMNNYFSKLINVTSSNSTNWYQLEDLSLINYYLTSVKSELGNRVAPGRALKFVEDLNKIVDGIDITFYLAAGMGCQDVLSMYESAFGPLIAFYNGYAYYAKEEGLYLRRVIYIPMDTEDTPEAYVAAAQKRIDNYLGVNNNVEVSFGDSLSTLNPNYVDSKRPVSTDGNYYNIKVLDRVYKFYIIKTEEENIIDPVFNSKNNSTDISITSDSGLVPLDTKVDAVELTSGDEYERIISILDLDANVTYDIKLYSEANEKYITKLADGTFNVRIPVPAELEGKNLVVYYVNENGDIEEHEVTPEEGYVSFVTNHFSIYTLGYKSENSDSIEEEEVEEEIEEEVPNTFDSVGNSLIVCILSLICLLGIAFYLNKKNKDFLFNNIHR